jgi:hypothetical protein
MNHPTNEEWMEFMYEELPAARQDELRQHARSCAECAKQVDAWRSTMACLDKYAIPARQRSAASFSSWGKWAIAAAILVLAGFITGRLSSNQSTEVESLKATVSHLSARLDSEHALLTNAVTEATIAATADTARLVAHYALHTETQQAQDQQTISVALKALDYRIDRLSTGLATVAVNTQDSFEQTQEHILALASANTARPTEPSGNESIQ